jgi:hypothetical protein
MELPLEHRGPETKDAAQLCVVETSEFGNRHAHEGVQSNSYQQSKPNLASSR